ncbi:hypothetical protein L218DRAFT_1004755 [Marasmius fiardii PR-910]|nr:hypothetical protein L218DRAFT_1004755 [Marasmius fiardii PR-910]
MKYQQIYTELALTPGLYRSFINDIPITLPTPPINSFKGDISSMTTHSLAEFLQIQGISPLIIDNSPLFCFLWLMDPRNTSDVHNNHEQSQLHSQILPLIQTQGIPAGIDDNRYYANGTIEFKPPTMIPILSLLETATASSSAIHTPNTPMGTATAPSGINTPPIGVILGVIAFIVLLLFTICIYRQKRKIRSTPGILEAFYREKMIKSAERVPEPPPSDLESLNRARLSVISEVSTHGERSTTDTSIHLSSDIASLQGPDYTIYTITESDSANESYAASEFTSTVEPSEYYYYGGAAPRTDRQMDIEKRIFQLQGQLIDLLDRTRSTDSIPSIPSTIGEVRDRIKKLRELQEGEWAREICDEPPAEMLDH